MIDPRDLLGHVLDTRYRIEAHLGSGAMGSVFRARHVRLPRSFAIKLLHPRLLSDAKVMKRFEREARLAGKLSHPNVISVVDVGEIDGVAYMVMDLASGPRLSDVLVGLPLERTRAIRILRQLCDGLDHAHHHGLIHRDLKPDNVIVERQGDEEIARIVDFGIAILRENTESSPASADRQITTDGIVLGTPHYMAPELATGRSYDHRVDLFALGVIAYEVLTGRMPFEGNGVEVMYANIEQDPPAMAIEPALETFTRRLMARRLDERFSTAAAARHVLDEIARVPATLRDGIGRALASVTVSAREPTPPHTQALGSAETIAMTTLERSVPGQRK